VNVLSMIFHMVVYALWTAVCFPVAFFSALVHPRSGGVWVGRRMWGPFLIRAGRAKLVVHGMENVDPKRPTIYAANHQSALDIPVMFVAIPVDFRYVAKKSLGWVPGIGWYLIAAGHILVDRGNRASALATLEKAAIRIRNGVSILMYAEGTRSEDARILPFKKGPFTLALRAGVVVCPVTIEGTHRIMPKNSWNITPGGEIHVKIGKPIDTRDYLPNDRERLMRDVRAVVIEQSLELGGKGGDPDPVPASSARSVAASAPSERDLDDPQRAGA
jgi:1-acyl-sn-glycerol-3-phosphate acyltransferase